MNAKQVHKYVERYLDATGCSVLEKSPAHFKVKLSPEADRELTNRPYYWSFVERTGAEPETMSFLFVTDAEKYDASTSASASAASAPAASPNKPADPREAGMQAALGRSLGFVPGQLGVRMPREELYFGSRRLDQLFDASRRGGQFVCLFEQPQGKSLHPYDSAPYTPWLGVNMKVSFACDMKREELHSFGVSLATGVCIEGFYDRLLARKLTPRLPANIHVAKSTITLNKAGSMIETALERKLKTYDYSWAEDAEQRLQEELERVGSYYEPLLSGCEDEEQRTAIAAQYETRKEEIVWQLKPRVTAEAVNAGIFYLSGIE